MKSQQDRDANTLTSNGKRTLTTFESKALELNVPLSAMFKCIALAAYNKVDLNISAMRGKMLIIGEEKTGLTIHLKKNNKTGEWSICLFVNGQQVKYLIVSGSGYGRFYVVSCGAGINYATHASDAFEAFETLCLAGLPRNELCHIGNYTTANEADSAHNKYHPVTFL